ncbi:MAG: hypothetical protein MUF15_11540 [Acidobacteria bacterium]|nr:hypothetical protein [Acidobacteriota bacterium]
MKKENKMCKTLIITLSFTLIILAFVPSQAFAYIYGNESCSAFYPYGCSTGPGLTYQSTDLAYTSTVQNLGQLIAEGAGYFASSQSDYLDFINKIEMSDLQGVDYKELRDSLLLSIENIDGNV